jgi:hypothetical protein
MTENSGRDGKYLPSSNTPMLEFMTEYIVMKANDRKIFNHKTFEEQASIYWQLMRHQPGFNQSKDTINFNQYLNVSTLISFTFDGYSSGHYSECFDHVTDLLFCMKFM